LDITPGPACPSAKGSFDLTRFNVSYWRNYERLLRSMQASGVVADIIVFHPYDNGMLLCSKSRVSPVNLV
jgi:hypothetical protein